MPAAPTTPIQYPTTGGNRHSSASAELTIVGPGNIQIPSSGPFPGWTKISYTWNLESVELYGHHPDPMGQTLGQAKYELEWEVWLAEYNMLLAALGQGFASQYIQFMISYSENGFDTIVDIINGVRLTSGGAEMTNNPDPLKRTIKCKPLKILPNGVDMLAIPLSPLTG